MDFIKLAFEVLPTTAKHPFAFVGYIVVTLSWVALAWKVKRNNILLSHLQKLPKKDRLEALRLEMGAIQLKEGLSPEQWIRYRQHIYYFIAFLVGCLAVVVMFAIVAVQTSKLESSTAELIAILKERESKFVKDLDHLYGSFQGDGSQKTKEELKSLKADVLEINKKRIDALRNGNLVLAHEIGNDLEQLCKTYQSLIESSKQRIQEYEELMVVLSRMDVTRMIITQFRLTEEILRLTELERIHQIIYQITPLEQRQRENEM